MDHGARTMDHGPRTTSLAFCHWPLTTDHVPPIPYRLPLTNLYPSPLATDRSRRARPPPSRVCLTRVAAPALYPVPTADARPERGGAAGCRVQGAGSSSSAADRPIGVRDHRREAECQAW